MAHLIFLLDVASHGISLNQSESIFIRVRSLFFFKNGPTPASFCLFSSFSRYNFSNTNWKKHRWYAWDTNPRPQNGRRRRNHRAMAAAQITVLIDNHRRRSSLSLACFAGTSRHTFASIDFKRPNRSLKCCLIVAENDWNIWNIQATLIVLLLPHLESRFKN